MGKIRIAPSPDLKEEKEQNDKDPNHLRSVKSARFAANPITDVGAPTGETPPLEVSVAVQEPKPGKTPKRGKQPKPEKPTRSAAPGPDGFIPRLKSLYYTRTGNKKEFVSFSQMSVPRFLSVEGDLPAEPPLSHEAKQEEQDLALMMNKRTRKVVAAPSIFEFRTYRDLLWIVVLLAVIGFMIGVGIKTYNLSDPPEYQCRRYPCEGPVRPDGTYLSHYVINANRNNNQHLPYDCLAQYNATLRVWTRVNFQVGNATFTPRTDCATKRALYYTLIVDGTSVTSGTSAGRIRPWSILMVAATPVAVNVVISLLAVIFRSQTYRVVFGLLIASSAAGVALAGFYGSLWAIAWGIMFLAAGATLFFTRFRHEKLEMPLGRVTRLLLRFPQLIVVSILYATLQCIWYVGWLWCYLRLAGRMGTAADVFLFFSLLWVAQYMNKQLYAVAGSVFAAWYFALTERSAKRRAVIRWPLMNGLKRALFNSQGTICAWATLDAMIKSLTVAQNSLRTALSPRSQVFAVLLGILKAIFRSINPYGLSYAMVYGKGLVLSSIEAFGLIEETNISLLAADTLLNYANFAVGGLSGLACVLVSWVLVRFYLPPPPNNDRDTYTTSLYLPAFLLGIVVGAPVMVALEGMLAMLYVNFSERPELLQLRDNDLYCELADLWIIARDEYELEMMRDEEFDREDEMGNLRDQRGETDSEDEYDVERAIGAQGPGPGKKKPKVGRGETLDTNRASAVAKHVVTLKL